MHDLKKTLESCERILRKLNIPYHHPVEVSVNTRAKKRWGQCQRKSDGYHISVSALLLEDDFDVRALKNTLLHELIHTCPDCMNHGPVWKKYAQKVTEATGMEIARTNDLCGKYGYQANGGSENATINQTGGFGKPAYLNYKYALVCGRCHTIGFFQRKGKAILHPEAYRCNFCKGSFKVFDFTGYSPADFVEALKKQTGEDEWRSYQFAPGVLQIDEDYIQQILRKAKKHH